MLERMLSTHISREKFEAVVPPLTAPVASRNGATTQRQVIVQCRYQMYWLWGGEEGSLVTSAVVEAEGAGVTIPFRMLILKLTAFEDRPA